MTKIKTKNNLIIYQAKSGAIKLKGDWHKETVWGTQKQIAGVFEVDIRTINEHILNIYKIKELDKNPTIRKFRIVQKEGGRQVVRSVDHYNLDMIISVGYRVNSQRATQFRQWATRVLRQHITKGFTINKSLIAKNYQNFLKTIEEIKLVLPEGNVVNNSTVIDLVKIYAQTWLSLESYDKSDLPTEGVNLSQVNLVVKDLENDLLNFKNELLRTNQATDMFGLDRNKDSLQTIIGNVFQSFDGKDLYPSIEEKAANLLYFVVKDHPFLDGNKRSGAFSFIWFLKKAKMLNPIKINPEALTALTLLTAESNPKDKGKIVGLILLMLRK